MMPDLGTYGFAVLGAWAVTLVLMAGLLGLTLWQGARARAALAETEARLARAGESGR